MCFVIPMKLGLPVYLGVIGDRKSVSKRGFCYKKVLKLYTMCEHLKIHSLFHFILVFLSN